MRDSTGSLLQRTVNSKYPTSGTSLKFTELNSCDDFGLNVLATLGKLEHNATVLMIGAGDDEFASCALSLLFESNLTVVDANLERLNYMRQKLTQPANFSEALFTHNVFVTSESRVHDDHFLMHGDDAINVGRGTVISLGKFFDAVFRDNQTIDFLVMDCNGCERDIVSDFATIEGLTEVTVVPCHTSLTTNSLPYHPQACQIHGGACGKIHSHAPWFQKRLRQYSALPQVEISVFIAGNGPSSSWPICTSFNLPYFLCARD